MADWNTILNEHGHMVWRTAFRIVGRADDAQDCMQETFVSALQMSRRQRIRNWPRVLRYLATARAIDCLRKRMKRRCLFVDETAMESMAQNRRDPAEQLQADELASRLRAAMGRLAPRQAEVFALHCFEKMSRREIADALGLRTNAVGVLLHEARRKLAGLLAASDHGRLSR